MSKEILILLCHCRSFQFGHELIMHKKLRSEYDWRTWQGRQSETGRWFEERVR